MGFSYPTLFLSDHPTAGFAAYPHHVWTTARPFDGDEKLIDVEMRQVWIHGSYMSALDKDVLKSALSIQQTLVGGEKLTPIFPALNEKLRESTLSWGFHSPLMYWNNSAHMIDGDEDIVQTVNDQSRSTSLLNVALRPASVFAGKVFHRRKLKAADALVITLMNKVEDGVGGKWNDEMQSLAAGKCKDCTLFPHDGDVTRNRVYQFSFVPLSARENIALGFAYACMALYVLLSLRRLKAFHSRFGLVVTAITQMTWSILASFTICSILKINLSMIPQNAYPFVVLVIGLENMFRLINAVVAEPATMATDQRIANALGDVGPVSVATAAQNLIMLSLLTAFVSPGVAAFCAFACIATLFDVFFLLTFFVAVLNVDIRRFELQDALARSTHQRAKRRPPPSKSQHTWFDALVQGRLPFSTRMAGTAVTSTFILSLNYHFFERHEKASSIRHLLGLARGGPPNVADFDTFTPPPMNATLTPGEWMRMQDFDTAREVMRLAKPGADSFVIRVFAPLIIVLSGADRTGAPLGTEAWVSALTSFARYHFYPVAVAIVFAVAFVAVLMNFLLYSEAGEDSSSDDDRSEDALTVQSVALPHKLDIVKLSGSENGHFVSIGLDRSIAIGVFDRSQQAYSTVGIAVNVLQSLHWPIRTAVIDDNAEWLALHCADDHIVIYHRATQSVTACHEYPDDNPAVIFKFVRLSDEETTKTCLLLLTSGGRLLSSCVSNCDRRTVVRLSETPLLGATLVDRKLVVATEDSKVVAYSKTEDDWKECNTQSLPITTSQGRVTGAVTMSAESDLGPDILVVTTAATTFFMDSQSLSLLGKVDAAPEAADYRTVLGPIAHCPACGSIALKSVAFVRASVNPGKCTVVILVADSDDDTVICIRNTTASCRSFDRTRKTEHETANAGAWLSLSSQVVLGLRRNSNVANVHVAKDRHIRHRRRASVNPRSTGNEEDEWEAYKLSIDGEIETSSVPVLFEAGAEHDGALYVNSAGPTAPLDHQSIAVAFGNQVKNLFINNRPSDKMQYTLLAVSALAASVFAESQAASSSEDLVSLLSVLQTALPSSVIAEALTNSAAVSSQIASEFAAGQTPTWFTALPSDIQTYLVPVATNSAALSSAVANITAAANATIIATATGIAGNASAVSGAQSGILASASAANSSVISRASLGTSTAGSSATSTGSGSSSTSGSSGSSSGSSSSSSAGASMPTAIIGAGLAGVLGVVGLFAL
ncbi:hypothetical protein LTR36_005320 [Oleoguttula mirabilis]|uniref:SSD domain-containing protein n=1 Tax=Oleoguttula mirabilis TaxID=1507867 RepID=A0AAV9JEQ9_9PEZI|nr:hypothetical protein LTR36_005320 [Oleoguttula mirabilis]